MVMKRSLYGYAAAYALALATGTALLIGALGSYEDSRATSPGASAMTRAELVMQRTAERGVAPGSEATLLAGALPNDKRGY